MAVQSCDIYAYKGGIYVLQNQYMSVQGDYGIAGDGRTARDQRDPRKRATNPAGALRFACQHSISVAMRQTHSLLSHLVRG